MAWDRRGVARPARRRAVVAILGSAAMTGLLGLAGSPQLGHAEPTSKAGWRQMAEARLRVDSSLSDVAVVGARDVWVVGQQAAWDVWKDGAVISHWDGNAWADFGIRNDSIGARHFRSVSASSPRDVWAVGEGYDSGPYVAHWDGTGWDRVNVPGLDSSWLGGVSAKGNRVVIVGNRDGKTLLVAFDGRRWTVAPKPISGSLYGVAVRTSSEAWAVGDTGTRPLAMRWNGKTWRTVPTPKVTGGFLRDVYAAAGKRAWAVGGVYRGKGRYRPLLLRWDGERWRSVRMPVSAAELYGITGDGKKRLWVSGFDPVHPGTAFFLRFDGRRWRSVQSAGPANSSAVRMQAVAAVPGQQVVWAVGHAVDSGDRYRDLVKRFVPGHE